MKDEFLLIISLIALIISLWWFYWLYSSINKIKQILFGIMHLLNEQRKDSGKESNLQDIYQKGKSL